MPAIGCWCLNGNESNEISKSLIEHGQNCVDNSIFIASTCKLAFVFNFHSEDNTYNVPKCLHLPIQCNIFVSHLFDWLFENGWLFDFI